MVDLQKVIKFLTIFCAVMMVVMGVTCYIFIVVDLKGHGSHLIYWLMPAFYILFGIMTAA